MGPRDVPNGCGKSPLHLDSIPGLSSPQPVTILTDLSGPTFWAVPYTSNVNGIHYYWKLRIDIDLMNSTLLIRSEYDTGCTIWGSNAYRGRILTLRRLMSYIYGAPILDVSRSHTTTQHSR